MFDTNTIPATQYMRPDGRAVEGEIKCDNQTLNDRAYALGEKGCLLTLEVLTTGQVSMAMEHEEHGDIAIAVFKNEPGAIQSRLDKLFTDAETFLATNLGDE